MDALFVTNGESVVQTLRQTRLGGDPLSWEDVYSEGPVPAGSRADLLAARVAFLAAAGWGTEPQLRALFDERDATLAAALDAGREVVLWFEHDLHDQLELLDVLTFVGDRFDRVSLIEVDSFPGIDRFHGLGQLSAPQLESLWDARRPLRRGDMDEAARVWELFRAGDLPGLADVRVDLHARPFLAAALTRLLEELPSTADGLPRTERQLLGLLALSPARPIELFLASQQAEEAPYHGDAWVWARLYELGSGDRPLVAREGHAALAEPPPRGDGATWVGSRLVPTELGRLVVAGEADAVAERGFDRWLGGAHLSGTSASRWDAARGVLDLRG